ncbi:MAG: hypothetical protein JNK57_22730, partial [Planctomycetaceae bacterium]|nr:hypothetical protein [Planctomycetaceae bacterium]
MNLTSSVESKTRPGYLSTDGKNPVSFETCQFFVSKADIEKLLKRKNGSDLIADAKNIGSTLLQPTSLFEGLNREEFHHGY